MGHRGPSTHQGSYSLSQQGVVYIYKPPFLLFPNSVDLMLSSLVRKTRGFYLEAKLIEHQLEAGHIQKRFRGGGWTIHLGQ